MDWRVGSFDSSGFKLFVGNFWEDILIICGSGLVIAEFNVNGEVLLFFEEIVVVVF